MSAIAALTAAVHQALDEPRARLAASADAVLEDQVAIARIHSPTFGEARRAAWVAERLERAGWRVRLDDAGNVVARRDPSSRPAIAVCAHLDTVYADADLPEPVREGHRVTAPGICDNGRGLAALIALAETLPASPDDAPVELVATTAEEGVGDLRGARHHVATRRPLAVIALDGAGDTRIVNTALGSRRYAVRFRGPGGHSWSAYGSANCVHAAARCAASLAALRLPAGTTLSVTRIGGGTAVNAIPADAWLEVDVRGTSEPELGRLEAAVRAAAERAGQEENARRSAGDALHHEVRRIGLRPCGATPSVHPLVEAAAVVTRLVGRQPALSMASTDASAAIAEGIPAIAIGAGGCGGAVHSAAEWFDATDAARGLERALTIVAAIARAGTNAGARSLTCRFPAARSGRPR